ncbi:MAG TPA: hypothetical protein VF939_23480 [Puia sp.]
MKNKNTGNGRLLVLDGKNGRILLFSADGTNMTTVLDKCGGTPDGIAIDAPKRHIYWTNMGEHWNQNDGFIERINFDGTDRTMIIPKGDTFTPKQIQLDLKNDLMYWCDREGMRVMRATLDGAHVTTLIEAGRGHADRNDETRHCVGIALDIDNGYLYWTQKGPTDAAKGRILRAGLALPPCADPAYREDIEVLWDHLPEPIDLELNHLAGQLYWTDRGAPPEGNTLNRASIYRQIPPEQEILCSGLKEAIGLALDIENDRVFFDDLDGNLYCCGLDGSEQKTLYSGEGMFTGMAYVANGLI